MFCHLRAENLGMVKQMPDSFAIMAYGHPELLATHRTTIELTKDNHLTTQGNCIVGVGASAGCTDLPAVLKNAIHDGATISVHLQVGLLADEFYGIGDPNLPLTHPRDIVFRTSSFICPRTILIRCTKAARDIERNLIIALRNPGQEFVVTLTVVI